MDKINITLTLDLDRMEEVFASLESLEGEAVFAQLSTIQVFKDALKKANDEFAEVEEKVKGLINERAKELYGEEWKAIKGKTFKISKSMTGSVYDITEKTDRKFLVIKRSANTKAINEYVKANNTLPPEVKVNPDRKESIRITVKTDEDDQA